MLKKFKLQVFLFYFRWSPTNVTCCAKMWKGSPPISLDRVEIERDPPRNLSHPHHHQRPFPQLLHNRLLQTPPTTQWDTACRSPRLLATCSFSAITITARPQTQRALQAKVTTKKFWTWYKLYKSNFDQGWEYFFCLPHGRPRGT